MHIVWYKNLRPKVWLSTFDEITSLLLEHRILVGNSNEFIIAEAFRVRNVGEVRVASLTEFTNNQRFIQLRKTMSAKREPCRKKLSSRCSL
jgi:hypothetical protein